MKKVELIVSALLLPIDFTMLILAGLSAYAIRFNQSIEQLPPALYQMPFGEFIGVLVLTALVWMLVFWWNGLYNIRGNRRIIEEMQKVFFACSTGVLLIIVLVFIDRDLFSSRFIILTGYGIALLYVALARLITLIVERALFRKGVGVRRVALIGKSHIAEVVQEEFKQKPTLGYHVVESFDSWNPETRQTLVEYCRQHAIDEVLILDPSITKEQSEEIFHFCDECHITFKYAAAVFDSHFTNIGVEPIGGIPIVEVKKTPLEGWGRILKRIFDIVASLFFIILFSPVMLVVAVATLLDSGRPVFFSRKDDGSKVTRIGQNGKPFHYFKFRSMKQNTDSLRYSAELQEKNIRKGTPMVKIVDDPRVTRVGGFIRRLSLDELPEFFLVLKGDMSLVGPRPHLPEEVAQYARHHKQVLNMKPGITGLAQVAGRSDLDFEDEVRLDTFYMEHWALWLDIIIVLKTPIAMLKKRKAL